MEKENEILKQIQNDIKEKMEREISFPCNEEIIRKLKVGDEVRISGLLLTSRDSAHKILIKDEIKLSTINYQLSTIKLMLDELKALLKDSAIYHCGPVMLRKGEKWLCAGAGPTTSERMELYTSTIIKKYHIRGIIGKGGMGKRTKRALQEEGAVYFQTVGGASALLSKCVVEVKKVFFLEEVGIPEAIWVIVVKDFPAVVSMDAHGESIYDKVTMRSFERAKKYFDNLTQ